MTNDHNFTKWIPSAKDVDKFEEHGWFTTPKILDDSLVEDAAYGASRYYEGERDHSLHVSAGFLDWKKEHGEGIRLNDYVSLQNEELKKLVHSSYIAFLAAKFSRCSGIRLFHDQLICKPPNQRTKIGWHIDESYWRTCSQAKSMLTAWVPLTDCTLNDGVLMVIDKSHMWSGNHWMNTFNNPDLNHLESKINSNGEEINKVPIVIKRGQINFHKSRTIHGSFENRGSDFRIAIAIHYQPDNNRYVEYIDNRGKKILHINDVLCKKDIKGHPNYSDQDICPLLWNYNYNEHQSK